MLCTAMCKLQNSGFRAQGSQPESCLWLGLENNLVRVRERSWFELNVNEHVVSQVTVDLFCIKPENNISLTLPSAASAKT